MIKKVLLIVALVFVFGTSSHAAPCSPDDFETRVTGVSQCLLMRRFGPSEPNVMVVWLHGDVSDGGPANYHFPLAQRTAEQLSASNVMAVALVRPGYPDGTGAYSTVRFNNAGRADSYTVDNLTEVGAAIERLRLQFNPKSVILVGHSGGAALSSILLGMKPQLADAAILISCPCDLVSWRVGRRQWTRSENPTNWAHKIPVSAQVFAFTGTRDDNTRPILASTYVDLLRSRGIDAHFVAVQDATHNSAARSTEVFDAISRLVHR